MQGNSPSVDLGAGRRDDHQAWADWARIGAIIAVASIHVLGPVSLGGPLSGTPFWWAVNVINSASRWSVPLFFMISGALLLNRSDSDQSRRQYVHRFLRIGVPLVAWSLIYVPVLMSKGVPVTFGSWLNSVALGAPYGHLYFLFALLGCYLVIPLVERLPNRELGAVAAFAIGWAIVQRALQLVMPHSPANALELWLYFVGFFVAGGWLARRPATAAARWLVVGLTAVAVTAAGTWWLVVHAPPSRWTYFYSYLSIVNVGASIAVFEFVRATEWPRPAWLRKLAGTTFGIYLCHPLILVAVQRYLPLTGGPLQAFPTYLVEMTVVLLGSLGLTLLLMRFRFVRSIVGG